MKMASPYAMYSLQGQIEGAQVHTPDKVFSQNPSGVRNPGSLWTLKKAAGKTTVLLLAATALLLLSACGSKKTAQVSVSPPPEQCTPAPAPAPSLPPAAPKGPATTYPKYTKAVHVEIGVASWYGSPGYNRHSANGEVYDMYAMTAAHRTLPLNSVVRVTNLRTGQSVVVRITDRGPFIENRMVDLSLAAAKQVDVWRPGTAKVKLEVIRTPVPIDYGGRWCVQIGAFPSPEQAARFKRELQRRYRSATVLQFTGSTGEWVRVRVRDDNKEAAEAVLRQTATPDGAAFLVRLD
jgi:rare lipoprotein A